MVSGRGSCPAVGLSSQSRPIVVELTVARAVSPIAAWYGDMPATSFHPAAALASVLCWPALALAAAGDRASLSQCPIAPSRAQDDGTSYTALSLQRTALSTNPDPRRQQSRYKARHERTTRA